MCKTGPWGQGPVFLQQLPLLAGLGLGEMAPGSVDHIHTVVECAKLAFADREAWYGDPEFAEVPLADLLSPQYAAQRRALVGQTASGDLRPGSPGGRRPVLPDFATAPRQGAAAGAWAGEPTLAHSGDTCHLDVADRFGNLVAATPSGGWLQQFAGDPRARVLPRHQGADVHPDPGPAEQPGAGQAAAHHAVAQPGAARRRALPGVRHTGRRPAGPVDAVVLPQPRAVRDEPAGGHRRPGLPHQALPVVVLAQGVLPAGRWMWRTGPGRA